jgi:hypothetical protein
MLFVSINSQPKSVTSHTSGERTVYLSRGNGMTSEFGGARVTQSVFFCMVAC